MKRPNLFRAAIGIIRDFQAGLEDQNPQEGFCKGRRFVACGPTTGEWLGNDEFGDAEIQRIFTSNTHITIAWL